MAPMLVKASIGVFSVDLFVSPDPAGDVLASAVLDGFSFTQRKASDGITSFEVTARKILLKSMQYVTVAGARTVKPFVMVGPKVQGMRCLGTMLQRYYACNPRTFTVM